MRPLLFRSLHPATKDFGNAPGLSNATAWVERPLSIKYLAQRSDAGSAQGRTESLEKRSRSLEITRMDSQPGIDKWTDKPGPDCALVIGSIPRAKVSIIFGLVVRVARIESSKADWCQKPLGILFKDRAPT